MLSDSTSFSILLNKHILILIPVMVLWCHGNRSYGGSIKLFTEWNIICSIASHIWCISFTIHIYTLYNCILIIYEVCTSPGSEIKFTVLISWSKMEAVLFLPKEILMSLKDVCGRHSLRELYCNNHAHLAYYNDTLPPITRYTWHLIKLFLIIASPDEWTSILGNGAYVYYMWRYI